MSARQVVTFGSCCQSSTFGGFWDLCSFSDQILASSQSSTFGGFWDLDKIRSEKLHLFAQRISDVAYSVCSKCSSPSLGCLRALEPGMSEKCPKSVRKVSEKCPKSVRNLVRKVTSFRPTDFGRRVFWVVATRGCVLSVLVQVWDVCGPWNLDVATKLDVRKVTSFRPTSDFGPDL